jgi:hypothetical protein
MHHQVVVGFDAREMWLDPVSQWSQRTADLYQLKDELWLKLDIEKPLSVDEYVWHSVFSELHDPRLWATVERLKQYVSPEWDETILKKSKLSVPDDIFTRGGSWRNLASMQDYLLKSWGAVWKPCYVIAVAEVLNDEDDEEDENGGLEPISPAVISDQWELLGYDVADYDLFSGLFGGRMDPAMAAKYRQDWADHLNENHLFSDPQKAFDYISVANVRKSDHRPFYVYALYGVEKKF